VRRAQVEGELAAERRVAERAARERAERAARIERLAAALVRDQALLPIAHRLVEALAGALGGGRRARRGARRRAAGRPRGGEGVAAPLRACAPRRPRSRRACASAATR
jgi:chromosome segregation protein